MAFISIYRNRNVDELCFLQPLRNEKYGSGCSSGEDMALTGFDDTLIAEHIAGGLTSARQPFRQMGRLGAESILSIIAGKPAGDFRLTLPTELVVRRSTDSRR